MKRPIKVFHLIHGTSWLLCVAGAWADDIAVDLPISAITVHPNSAIVTRADELSLPAGEHRLVIRNLPPSLDPARLQLSIPGQSVRLGSLEIEEVHAGNFTAERERQLRDELQALEDRRKEISDRIETANLELQLLSSLATGGDSATMKPAITGNELGNVLTTVNRSSEQARARKRAAEVGIRAVDREIEQKRFEINQVATSRVVGSVVRVHLRIDSPLRTTVALIHPEDAAQWSWLYEARLDTASKRLSLLRHAVVSQGSGEDWSNVALTLTTANHEQDAVTPELGSLFVDLYEAERVRATASFVQAPIPVQALEEVVVTASRIQRDEAEVIASQYLVEYKMPGRVTVTADYEDKILPIDEKSFSVELVARTVPELDARAFLEARFTYGEATPLQAGEMQLYRDGAFIGTNQASAFLPQQAVRLAFGADERIRVDLRREAEASRDAGIVRRSNVNDVRVRYEITSHHAEPVPVEVLGRIPVPRNSRIDVEQSREATPVSERDVDGKSGLLLWQLTARPQETATIRHYYTVSYPKDTELEFEDDD